MDNLIVLNNNSIGIPLRLSYHKSREVVFKICIVIFWTAILYSNLIRIYEGHIDFLISGPLVAIGTLCMCFVLIENASSFNDIKTNGNIFVEQKSIIPLIQLLSSMLYALIFLQWAVTRIKF